jgi:hypothetical protein
MTEIPEKEYQEIITLSERIKRRGWEQDDDLKNLTNLLHALHGEGIRGREYTPSGKPSVFVNGIWVER